MKSRRELQDLRKILKKVKKCCEDVKNLSNDENHLNMFYSNIYDPSDKKLTKQSSYFDDTIDYADDLKSGESYTKYYYFEYTTNGTYKIKFNKYTSQIDVNVEIKK